MEFNTWREWLASLSPEEKKKVQALLLVSHSTLSFWIHTDRRPRPKHFYGLINYNPDVRELIEQEFPDAFESPDDEGIELHIAIDTYEDIFGTFAYTADAVNGQTMALKVFQYMSNHLDPGETGLLILPSLCLPDDEIITHLHTSDGYSVGILKRPSENAYFEIGRDSLAGTAVHRRRTVLYPQQGFLDHRVFAGQHEKIGSAGAFPLWRRGFLAGALLVASVHSSFFTESRVKLCGRYSDLYALSLHDTQFYDPRCINLCVMREGLYAPEPNGAN
jgi:hypothetical protein